MQSYDLARFTNISKIILQQKTPSKERYIRYKQAKFMNKNLQKGIMNCSRLLNDIEREEQKQLDLHIKDR